MRNTIKCYHSLTARNMRLALMPLPRPLCRIEFDGLIYSVPEAKIRAAECNAIDQANARKWLRVGSQ